MHALDLNLFNNHVQKLFKIDLERLRGDHALTLTTATPTTQSNTKLRHIKWCKNALNKNGNHLLYELLGFDHPIMHMVCEEFGVLGPGHTVVIGT